jgi:acetyl-CoA carboxylase biotin carboxyl carrier protein
MELPQVDLEQLKALMKLMETYDFDEIDVRDEGKRLHLQRNHRPAAGGAAVVMPPVMAAAPGAPPAAEASGGADSPPAGVKVIASPMVGTFYAAASPDAAPFVEEGHAVTEDSVLCIIEAMKVMNEIKAECSGEVVSVLVANGEAVEYGQPLYHVKLG